MRAITKSLITLPLFALPLAAPAGSAQKPAAPVAAASSGAKGGKNEVVREAPPSRSTEAIYEEQHALFDKRFTLETDLTYSRNDLNRSRCRILPAASWPGTGVRRRCTAILKKRRSS